MGTSAWLSNRMKLDCIAAGLLSISSDWSVHLGSNSPVLSGDTSIGAFLEASYPGYAMVLWPPTPLAINGAKRGIAVGISITWPNPAAGTSTVQSCYVTYQAPDGSVQLLESFILPGAPIVLRPNGPVLVTNLAFDDFDANH
jgi:hypothetical protein